MNFENKERLEQLKKENNYKIAKNQLVEDLMFFHKIDISKEIFVSYETSEKVRRAVYKKIRIGPVTIEKSEYEGAKHLIGASIEKFRKNENQKIFFYFSVPKYSFRNYRSRYSDSPIALISTIKLCKEIIFKLLHEVCDDLIVVEENLKYGFVISKDEYEYVSIEYWGHES